MIIAALSKGSAVLGIEVDRFVEIVHSAINVAACPECQGAIGIKQRSVRVQRDGCAIVRSREAVLPTHTMSRATIAQCLNSILERFPFASLDDAVTCLYHLVNIVGRRGSSNSGIAGQPIRA